MDINQLVKDWRKHLYYVQASRKIKSSSKQSASEIESHCFNCFDLQQVLDTPYTNVGDVFYKRQLSCYNFTINSEGKGYCYLWSEDEGKRGTVEIGTCLIDFSKEKASEGVRHITSFCDGCGGQNKNKPIAATLCMSTHRY